MHWSEIWEGTSFRSKFFRAALTPISWLYAGIWQTYLALYRLGIKKPREPHGMVLCIGNLTAGGSGKSPTTVFVADCLRELGYPVVIGCSGYGSPKAEAAQVAPEGELDAQDWGDEPAMLRWLRPDIPLIVGRRRVLAAELCHEHFPGSVLLMDDGFQHLPLKKHLTILLEDPHLHNRRCLPAGPYREPFGNRKRADLVIPDNFELKTEVTGFTSTSGKSTTLKGEVAYLCALARPDKFIASLTNAGLEPVYGEALPDHDPLTRGNLLDGFPPNLPLVVTAKDWVKLKKRADARERPIFVAIYQATVQPEDQFNSWLKTKLDAIRPRLSSI